jgi:hypothetical protein
LPNTDTPVVAATISDDTDAAYVPAAAITACWSSVDARAVVFAAVVAATVFIDTDASDVTAGFIVVATVVAATNFVDTDAPYVTVSLIVVAAVVATTTSDDTDAPYLTVGTVAITIIAKFTDVTRASDDTIDADATNITAVSAVSTMPAGANDTSSGRYRRDAMARSDTGCTSTSDLCRYPWQARSTSRKPPRSSGNMGCVDRSGQTSNCYYRLRGRNPSLATWQALSKFAECQMFSITNQRRVLLDEYQNSKCQLYGNGWVSALV